MHTKYEMRTAKDEHERRYHT